MKKILILVIIFLVFVCVAVRLSAQTGIIYITQHANSVKISYTQNGNNFTREIPQALGSVNADNGVVNFYNAGNIVVNFTYRGGTQFNVSGANPPTLDSLITLLNKAPYFHQSLSFEADSVILPTLIDINSLPPVDISANQTIKAAITAGQSLTAAIAAGQTIGTSVSNFPAIQSVSIVYDSTITYLSFYTDTDTIDSVPAGCTRVYFTWNNSFAGTVNGLAVTDGTYLAIEAPVGKKLPAIPFQRTAGKFRYDAIKP